jgi:hypothetical protein
MAQGAKPLSAETKDPMALSTGATSSLLPSPTPASITLLPMADPQMPMADPQQ